MVTEWGMSELLGPLRYSANEQEVFLGHSVTQRQNMSGETAKLIDQKPAASSMPARTKRARC